MNRTRPTLLSVLVALMGFLSPATVLAQTAEEIVAKHLEATGLSAVIDQVKDGTERWVFSLETFGAEGKGDFLVTKMRPDRYRIEIDAEVAGQKFHVVRGYDGERGWEIRQGSFSLLTGEQLIEIRNDALRAFGTELIRPDEIGARLVLGGQEEVDGKKAWVIEVIPKEGRKLTHFFDADTYLLIKSEGTASEQGTEVEVETWVTDYTVENKVKVPSALDVIRSFPALDQEQLFKLRRVDSKVNTGLEQADFSPPSTGPPAGGDAGPVIARYIEAIGGEAALRGARDRVETWNFGLSV